MLLGFACTPILGYCEELEEVIVTAHRMNETPYVAPTHEEVRGGSAMPARGPELVPRADQIWGLSDATSLGRLSVDVGGVIGSFQSTGVSTSTLNFQSNSNGRPL